MNPRHPVLPVAFAVLLSGWSARAHAADAQAPDDWPQKTSAALAQLGSGLDMAASNPAAAKPILMDVESSLSAIIENAPCGERDLARLRFNRGLAHEALGDHAAALLDFKASDALLPTAAARSHIETERRSLALAGDAQAPAKAAAKDKPAVPPQPLAEQATRLIRKVAPETRWWSSLAVATGFWLVLGLWWLGPRPFRRPAVLGGAAALLALAALGFASLRIDSRNRNEVVVLSSDCVPRSGPDAVAYPPASFEGKATLPRGSELLVLESRDFAGRPGRAEWLKVRRAAEDTADAAAGVWIPASSVGWVNPDKSNLPAT